MNSVKVTTRSYAWDLPFVKLSDLFSHAAACNHSSSNGARKSPFESELLKQGYILSQPVDKYGTPVTRHIFLKPSEALQEAINSSPYAGLPCEWVELKKVGQGEEQRIMIRMTMVSRSRIYFTYDLFTGFITLEELAELKKSLQIKDNDHFIELI